jgi:pimeloyl-ACP methyl ester carboxylesterase
METLSIEHRVYALDLWGFGDSDKSEKRFSLDEYVSLVKNFINELGLASPVIVGHALGACVALEYASQADEIKKVVAVSLPLTQDAVNNKLWNYQQSSGLSRMFWKPIPTKDVEQEAARAAENVIPMTLDALAKLNISARLKALSCDVLIVYGDKDDVVSPEPLHSLEAANGLAHVRNIVLPGAKHFPMIDDGSKFNRLLRDFTDKQATLESLELKEEWRRRTR